MSQSALRDLKLDFGTFALIFITVCACVIPVAVVLLQPLAARKSDALRQTHWRAGVRHAKRNLKNEYTLENNPRRDGAPIIQSLCIYPVKSCRGIEVTLSRVLPQGLQFDRLFMFAQLKSPFPVSLDTTDEAKSKHTWSFVTQRQFPLLATVKVDLWLPYAGQTGKYVGLRFPWKEDGWRGVLSDLITKISRGIYAKTEMEILLPVDFPSAAEIKEKGYVLEDVKIWKEIITALNISTELPRELMLYLGVSNKLGLFRVDPSNLREVYRCAPHKDEAGYQPVTGFQDAYPLHMLNLESVQAFSKEVPKDEQLKELDISRFRANMIISGAPAYDEETWKLVRFMPGISEVNNDSLFHVSCRTVRCDMLNVDQVTGDRHPREPDRSLRSQRAVDPGAPRWGCLGMQMTPLFVPEDEGFMEVGVGMAVAVELRGAHVYIPQ